MRGGEPVARLSGTTPLLVDAIGAFAACANASWAAPLRPNNTTTPSPSIIHYGVGHDRRCSPEVGRPPVKAASGTPHYEARQPAGFQARRPAKAACHHERDGRGMAVPSGIYLYRLDANGATLTRRMVLLK